MISKYDFIDLFKELGKEAPSYMYTTIHYMDIDCLAAVIHDNQESGAAFGRFEYPLDCIDYTKADFVNKVRDVIEQHFHMKLEDMLYMNKMEESIKSMEKALKYEPGIIQDTYDRLCGPATTSIYFNPGRTNNKLNLDLSYFCSWRIPPKWREYAHKIDRVIFNDPATIILWKSGEKTVVKCGPNEEFDKEKGLAMALCKYILGNKGNFNEFFKKFMEDKK